MILVSGDLGYLGKHLVKVLGKVEGIDLKRGTDVISINPRKKYDFIYHLAAQTSVEESIKDPFVDAWNNIMGTINLLKAKGKFIYPASAASLDIQSPYGLSKKTAEEYIKLLSDNYVICRLPNVYGKGGHGVLDIWENSEEVIIYGDGEQARTFVHVDDIVRGLIQAQDWPTGEYSLGGESKKLIDLARKTGKPIVFKPPKTGEVMNSYLGNTTPDWQQEIKL